MNLPELSVIVIYQPEFPVYYSNPIRTLYTLNNLPELFLYYS